MRSANNLVTFLKDEIDRAALNAELKSIIKSGILDLGVLGLWERDPDEVKLEINNSIPRQVKEKIFVNTEICSNSRFSLKLANVQ